MGIILLPIVGNAAEHVSAVTFAMKDKMNLCIGIAVSSSLQIGLLVSPVLVLTGWAIGQPMTLFFEDFETVILFASMLIVNYLIQDGRSNWLEGVLLLVSGSCVFELYVCVYICKSNVIIIISPLTLSLLWPFTCILSYFL